MIYRAVVFDLDGTLLDTLEDLANSVNRTLASKGFATHPVDAYRQFVGDGVIRLFERALPKAACNPDTIQACVEAYHLDYGQNWAVATRLYPQIPAMLTGLAARGVKLAVFSNKPDEFTQKCVQRFLGAWPFDAVLGASKKFAIKPNPAGALEIARRLEVPPEAFVYVGDSGVDMRTATSARMRPVGAAWGFRGREELQRDGARVLIEQPLELLDCF